MMTEPTRKQVDDCIDLIIDQFEANNIDVSIAASALFTFGMRILVQADYPIDDLITQIRRDHERFLTEEKNHDASK